MELRRISSADWPRRLPQRHTAETATEHTCLRFMGALLLFSHRRSEGKPDQQSVRIEEATHRLEGVKEFNRPTIAPLSASRHQILDSHRRYRQGCIADLMPVGFSVCVRRSGF
jgi:hypothetical protein